jgi:hypothetical protein
LRKGHALRALSACPLHLLQQHSSGEAIGELRVEALIALAVLALVSFVSPFSFLTNPPGLYYQVTGCYNYDLSSRVINRFATLVDDPTRALALKLEHLIG